MYPSVSLQLHRKQGPQLYPLLVSLQHVGPFRNSIHLHIVVVLIELPMVDRWVRSWMLVEVGTDTVKGIVVSTDKEQSLELTVEQVRRLFVAADTIEFGYQVIHLC